MCRPARVRLVLAAAILLACASVAIYFLYLQSDPRVNDDPPDPRLTFDTPFRNVHPDVAYVGDAACAPCHADIDHSYHRHPMGRSAALPTAIDMIEKVGAARGTEFTAFSHVRYRVEQRSDRIIHSELLTGSDGRPFAQTEAEVVAIIGSGTRGLSYLCSREGSLWQSGISWFSEKRRWDASPSFWPGRHARRGVVPECLFCHVSHVQPVPDTVNRFREPIFASQLNIGCERCHGPGALHVEERSSGVGQASRIDTSIVNPRHLAPDLREDICHQCHFQGEQRVLRRGRAPFDYRPGLPLDLFISIYVRHPDLTDYHKSVGQVEQMAVSKCSAGSGGRLGCISCHDPHAVPTPATREVFYRQRCLNCHQDQGCALPAPERDAKNDSCITCHMPKSASSTIAHTAVTDHRVVRRPDTALAAKTNLPANELPLTGLGEPAHWPEDPERARDLAIALTKDSKLTPDLAREVISRLQAATTRNQGDVVAWETLASLQLAHGNAADALRSAESTIKLRPNRERALLRAAEAALMTGNPEQARDYASRALAVNPGEPEHRLRLAQALIEATKYSEAEAELRALLSLTPNHPQGRATLAVCMFKQGRAREALDELDRAAAIDPRDGPELRRWFSTRTR